GDFGWYVSGEFGHQWLDTSSYNYSVTNFAGITYDQSIPGYNWWNAGIAFTYKAATLDLRYSGTDLSGNDCNFIIGNNNACGDKMSSGRGPLKAPRSTRRFFYARRHPGRPTAASHAKRKPSQAKPRRKPGRKPDCGEGAAIGGPAATPLRETPPRRTVLASGGSDAQFPLLGFAKCRGVDLVSLPLFCHVQRDRAALLPYQ
ncbi:MAG: hypothetical protein B7Z41_05355, partial [Rhizobiales bacterium 12-66-7]